MSQCPDPVMVTPSTLSVTKRACEMRKSPPDFWPPSTSIGIGSLVLANSALSLAGSARALSADHRRHLDPAAVPVRLRVSARVDLAAARLAFAPLAEYSGDSRLSHAQPDGRNLV